jgi:hypothetical protein
MSARQEGEAVALFAELLLDAAYERRASASGGVMDSALGGGSGSVAPFPEKRGKACRAA